MTTPGPTLPGAQPAPVNPDSALGSPAGNPPAFTRRIGETPRAFQAFLAWFQLGPQRSLQAVGQKLLDAVSCFLENLGDRQVERVTMGQAARALQIATRLSREALHGPPVPEEPAVCSLQQELEAALNKAYGQPSPAAPADNSHPPLAC